MKKCFALLLTLLLALGLTATAFAVEGETPTRPSITVDGQTYEDITEVPITKLYQLVNDGAVSPAETFRFSIAADSVTDSAITAAADMPVFTPSTFDIAFSEGAATAAGASGSFALPLPEFSSVGIYTYKITESAGSTAGVAYNGQALYLKITVLQPEGEGKVRVAAVHLGSADGSKQDNILNTYSAGTLNVTKTVAGLLGDRDKDFRFHVTLTRQSGYDMNSTIGFSVAGVDQSFTPAWDDNGQCTVDFTLKHGQTASLTNLPYGMSYTVTEDDYTGEGYTTAVTGDSGTIEAAAATAEFTNTKGGSIDNGVLLDSAPYAVLLTMAAADGAAMFLRRRSQRS